MVKKKRLWQHLVKMPFLFLLMVYRYTISPWLPKACRFCPSCSVYAEEAFSKYDPVRAGLLCSWRLVRCQPFGGGGWDPVPATFKFASFRQNVYNMQRDKDVGAPSEIKKIK